MKIGLLFSFRGAPFRPVDAAALYRSELDLMVAAEAMGYDAVWISEHHFVPDGHAVSLFVLAAACAARTGRIRIGLQVLLLPLHDPVGVAEDAAVVDAISNGRLDLGLGVGYRPVEFDGQGIPRRERGARFEEYAPLLKRLLSERDVHHAGRFKRLAGITVTPPPVQRPHPPLWMGARSETGIRRAARLGCHFVSTGHPAHRRLYLDSLVEHGRDPADFHLCQLVLAHVAESRARLGRDGALAPPSPALPARLGDRGRRDAPSRRAADAGADAPRPIRRPVRPARLLRHRRRGERRHRRLSRALAKHASRRHDGPAGP